MGRVLTDALPSGPRGGRGGAAVFPDVLRDALSSLPSSPPPKFPPSLFRIRNRKNFLRQIDETQTRTLSPSTRRKRANGVPATIGREKRIPRHPLSKNAKGAKPPKAQKRKRDGERRQRKKRKRRQPKQRSNQADDRTAGREKATAKNPQTTRHAAKRTTKRTHSAKPFPPSEAMAETRATPSMGRPSGSDADANQRRRPSPPSHRRNPRPQDEPADRH